MTDPARRAYLALGRGFLILGGAIAALAIADAALALGLFRGSPLGTALFLAVVGGLLVWTVRQADAQRAADADAVPPEGVGAPDEERADEGGRGGGP
ncbi:MAG: hypothetical protein P1P87_15465 [Trueperaceae bacterium]|nr:hypothetical protein [Trueperaceae bacterium]